MKKDLTPAAVALVDRLENKSLLSVFRDPAGVPWYELPLCFTPYWKTPLNTIDF